jgi:hypothetical protein
MAFGERLDRRLASQISSCISALPQSSCQNFVSWLDSLARLTVKFEVLYSELIEDDPSVVEFPVLHGICDYLDLPRKSPSELAGTLGRGLTSSGRMEKVGVYRHRSIE